MNSVNTRFGRQKRFTHSRVYYITDLLKGKMYLNVQQLDSSGSKKQQPKWGQKQPKWGQKQQNATKIGPKIPFQNGQEKEKERFKALVLVLR